MICKWESGTKLKYSSSEEQVFFLAPIYLSMYRIIKYMFSALIALPIRVVKYDACYPCLKSRSKLAMEIFHSLSSFSGRNIWSSEGRKTEKVHICEYLITAPVP